MFTKRTTMMLTGCGVGLGAGLIYFLDPARGRRRRALLRDKTLHFAGEARDVLDRRGRDLSNRARGLVAEVGSHFRCEEVSDEKLTRRVRSKMGRVVSEPSEVEVLASDGRVTLRGIVFAHEAEGLLRCVARVRGVHGVENQLKVKRRHGEAAPAAHRNGNGRSAAGLPAPGRLLATFAGSGLALYGARRRGVFGSAVSMVGVQVLKRGLAHPGA